jgi:phosphoserine aminotransferase
MARIFNFNPGPATLPLSVLEKARDQFVDFKGKGMSLVEMSHRGKDYDEVHHRAMGLIAELLGLPASFKVLFLGGGATLQFGMVPLNFLAGGKSADYTLTGSWAKKAVSDAKKVGKVNLVFDGTADGFMSLPDPAAVKATPGAAYLHLTSNETISGTQWQSFPDAGEVPLVADMSSDFLSRRVPVERFGLIYAGAQKNLGPAGTTVVLLREDMLAKVNPNLPAYLNYKNHWDDDSLYNTPPAFAIWLIALTLEWLKALGGIEAAEKLAAERATLIYGAADASGGFYRCPVASHCRSRMNIVFRLPSEDLEKQFIEETSKNGLAGLKGHRSVGGCRASVYNAMPVEGARRLAELMTAFARRHG